MDHRSQVAPSGVTVLSNGELICADQPAGVILRGPLLPTAEGHCESPRARQKVVEQMSTRLKGLITSFPLVLKRRAGAATLTREGRDRVETGPPEVRSPLTKTA